MGKHHDLISTSTGAFRKWETKLFYSKCSLAEDTIAAFDWRHRRLY